VLVVLVVPLLPPEDSAAAATAAPTPTSTVPAITAPCAKPLAVTPAGRGAGMQAAAGVAGAGRGTVVHHRRDDLEQVLVTVRQG